MKIETEAILFDIGGTLRYTTSRSPIEKENLILQIMRMVGAQEPVEEFTRKLTTRAKAYQLWARKTYNELNESDLWTQWMLPEFPKEKISAEAIPLNQLYRAWLGLRLPFPESRDVVVELFRRGYRLGVVSNTTSSVEVPELLRELEISGCFETVILSAVAGRRKPSPDILLEATRRMEIAPEKCAYVGDRIDRDLTSARAAGFASAIIINSRQEKLPATFLAEGNGSELVPDYRIDNLRELLEIFPPRQAPQPETVYDASLSTMYAIGQFPALSDFFEFARRSGFARIELNHKITSAMLDGIDLRRYPISSVHEPCPADISEAELKERDWLISSQDEECRRAGVRAIMRSIDLASQIGAKVVVIHAGQSCMDEAGLEKKLRALLAANQQDTHTYRSIHAQMCEIRARFAPSGFASVKKSILELLEYASPRNICLGLENRYHYLEFPDPRELEALLSLACPDQIGFILDTGHAEVLDHLGFFPKTEWLERFSARIVGTHMHDIVTTTDHFAPGLGTVDFRNYASYLPEHAIRTCELQTINMPEQVKAGLRLLADQGCIRRLSN